MAKFLIQAVGFYGLSDPGVLSLYAGFFLYGIGMGGTSDPGGNDLGQLLRTHFLDLRRGLVTTSVFSAGGPLFSASLSTILKAISCPLVSSSACSSLRPF